MNWKIGDEAKALYDIYKFVGGVAITRSNVEKVISKGQVLKVSDVIRFDCKQFLNVGIKDDPDCVVTFSCRACKTDHIGKKKDSESVFMPHNWFIKPKEDSIAKRIKRKLKGDNKSKSIISVPVPKRKGTPKKTPDREEEVIGKILDQ